MRLRVVAIAVLVAGFQCFAGYNAAIGATDGQEEAWPTKSWPVSTPEEQGIDSASLARLIETVGTYKQDSLMSSGMERSWLKPTMLPMSPASATI